MGPHTAGFETLKVMGLVLTIFGTSESFPFVIIPHDFTLVCILMNQKARRIDLTLFSSKLIFCKFKSNSLECKFSYRFCISGPSSLG